MNTATEIVEIFVQATEENWINLVGKPIYKLN